MGLTDDVGCAVMRVSRAAGPAACRMENVASIPGLAYVAAGKMQKKHLLLGAPGGDIAAVLVETHKFVYVYRNPARKAIFGQHQVIDMAVPEGSSGVLGAALVQVPGSPARLLIVTSQQLLQFEL